jgi:predicted membrane chloride channel (bestrophin family)
VALPCAAVAAAMEFVDSRVSFLQSFLPDDETYSSFTFLLGFFLTFHTAHAYQRFWYGAQMIYTISGNFIDMASLLLSFTRHSSGLDEQRAEFKVTLIRLASLLFAVSLEEVTGHQNEDDISDDHISDKMAIDPRGLDQSMLDRALSARHRPQVVCQMIQNLVVDQISTGVLSIPPPILTRAFQEQSNAMIQFHEVRACSEVPFPFPFVIVAEVLLVVHWIVTPFFMGYWCPHPASAAFYTLVVTLTLWSLHGISMELDNPFGQDSNDIATEFLRDQLNQQLVSVLIESELGLPKNKQSTTATLVDDLLSRFERASGTSLPSSWPKRRLASLNSGSTEGTERGSQRSSGIAVSTALPQTPLGSTNLD